MTPAEVLLNAADIVAKRGWTKGSLSDPKTGAVCVLGAINAACSGKAMIAPLSLRLITLHKAAIYCAATEARSREAIHVRSDETALVEYNDIRARGKRQIISLLRAAAKRCQPKGGRK